MVEVNPSGEVLPTAELPVGSVVPVPAKGAEVLRGDVVEGPYSTGQELELAHLGEDEQLVKQFFDDWAKESAEVARTTLGIKPGHSKPRKAAAILGTALYPVAAFRSAAIAKDQVTQAWRQRRARIEAMQRGEDLEEQKLANVLAALGRLARARAERAAQTANESELWELAEEYVDSGWAGKIEKAALILPKGQLVSLASRGLRLAVDARRGSSSLGQAVTVTAVEHALREHGIRTINSAGVVIGLDWLFEFARRQRESEQQPKPPAQG